MNWRIVSLVLLLAAVAGTSWLVFRHPSPDDDDRAKEILPAGYYLLDAIITGTDRQGAKLYALTANRIDHDPVDDSVSLQELVLNYAADDESQWRLDAKHGRMTRGGNEIDLSGAVRILENVVDSGPASTITTARLTIDLVSQQASTTEPVRIDVDTGFLVAEGLRADLQNKRLKLLSNVHGEFVNNGGEKKSD